MFQNTDFQSMFPRLMEFLQANGLGIILALVLIFLVAKAILGLTNRYVHEEVVQHAIRKWTRYIAIGFALVWIVIVYSYHEKRDTPTFLFIIGIFLAGVAISMRDIFSNFVGWIVIVSGKGFKAGDRIKIGELAGDVIDIGMLRTVMAEIGGWVSADQSTGRLVSVPNSMVLDHEIFNYTQGYDFIWHELKILITFESNWQKAEEILNEIAAEDFEQKKDQIQDRLKGVRRRYLLRYNFITPKVYVHIGDSGVELALRYLVRARRRRTVEDTVSRMILDRFNRESDIEFAYPTIRMYRAGEQPSGHA